MQLRLDSLNFLGGWVGGGVLCPGSEHQLPIGCGPGLSARAPGGEVRRGLMVPGPGVGSTFSQAGLAVAWLRGGLGAHQQAQQLAWCGWNSRQFCMGFGSSTQIPGTRLSCAVGWALGRASLWTPGW